MKNLIFISLLLIAMSAHAQVTITKANSPLRIGDSYSTQMTDPIEVITNINPELTGANYNWDFSNFGVALVAGASGICVDPESTPFIDSIDNADICIKSPNGELGIYQYFSINSDCMEFVGLGWYEPGNNNFTKVHNKMTNLNFPANYQDSFEDDYVSELIMEDHSTFGIDTVTMSFEIDGYGTVTTPAGTFDDVLRVVRTSSKISYFVMDGELISFGTDEFIEYLWYQKGFPLPILNIVKVIGYEGYNASFVTEMGTSGVNDLVQKESEILLYPNPCTDRLNINLGSDNYTSWRIQDITGKIMLEKKGSFSNTISVQIEDLPKGHYIIQVSQGQLNFREHFIKQ